MEDHVLFRSLKGHSTAEEERAVAMWRAASPANERRYRELRLVLDATLRGRTSVRSERPALLDLLAQASPEEGRRSRLGLLGVWSAIAALVLAAVGITALWFRPPAVGLGVEELVTGTTETATLGLSDGTVVRLAPQSQIRFTRRAHDREVELKGRAFFAVAKQNGAPFRVTTAAGTLTVLGTRFDVESRQSDLRLLVVEGRVAVAAAQGGEVKVGAGQMSRVLDGKLQPSVRIPDLGSATKWMGQFLAFRATPLKDVARELEQMYGVRVRIEDSSLADRTVTTWFSDRSLDQVVRIVCAVAVVRCDIKGGVVTIGAI